MKRKDSLETRSVLRFLLEFIGWQYREYIKIVKIAARSKDLPFGYDAAVIQPFSVLMALEKLFRSSEVVEKIATDETDGKPIANTPFPIQFGQPQHVNNSRKDYLLGSAGTHAVQ